MNIEHNSLSTQFNEEQYAALMRSSTENKDHKGHTL